MSGKIFAIGDIHGCAAKLALLMNRLPFDRAHDTLVFLGDYLDRGPDSKGVLEQLCALRGDGVRVIPLMGNHEYLLLEYHRSGDQALLPYLRRLGLENTLESYGGASLSALASLAFMPKEHRDFLASLLPHWQTEEYIFVHAGLRHDQPLAEQDISDLCEVREPFLSQERDYGKRVIFGHTPFATPLLTPFRIGIDTGAVYGNLLTAVELPGLHFHHAA
ncbi:metallophosphoesterase [Thiovibrio frasassiensis]|uniref:Metallophosphoesterase n=1 Tax=Thiovibrio frasassiensis TaxID=2984131 RepID=A0A9X4MKV9_9BACT|nr:metallophosphoesterase [Thiovibrio frasassiensis]MDG4476674.1 metallophosphoesterase [Thiovibrio frasassiensis]